LNNKTVKKSEAEKTSLLNDVFITVRKNSGPLYPLAKFLITNTALSLVILLVPFQVFFWIFQTGYLSEFGVNHNLLTRPVIDSEPLWIDFFIVVNEKFTWVYWALLLVSLLCGLFAIIQSVLSVLKENKSNKIEDKEKIDTNPQKNRGIFDFINLTIEKLEAKDNKLMGAAKLSYLVVFLVLLLMLALMFGARFFYQKGIDKGAEVLSSFVDSHQCNNGHRHLGCYRIITPHHEYKGLLIARTDTQYFIHTGHNLIVLNNTPETVVYREYTYEKEYLDKGDAISDNGLN